MTARRIVLLFGSTLRAWWRVDLFLLVRFLALLLLVASLRIPLGTILRAVLPLLGLFQSLFTIGHRMHLSEHLQNKLVEQESVNIKCSRSMNEKQSEQKAYLVGWVYAAKGNNSP